MISRVRPLAGAGLITLVTVLAFGAQLGDELTDVDVQPLILTGLFHSLGDAWSVLITPFMQGRMANGLYWRPVTSLSYGLDALVWGLRPIGFHLTDLILHLATSLVLFAFVRRLWRELDRPGGEAIALIAALLFALHPIQVLNVPAIARRGDVLVGLFLVSTLLFLLAGFRDGRLWPNLAAQASCILGMGAKESGFAIPVVALIFCLCCHPGQGAAGIRRKLLQAVPLVAWGALMFAVRAALLHDIGETGGPFPYTWSVPYSVWVTLIGLVLPGFPLYSSARIDVGGFPTPHELTYLLHHHAVFFGSVGLLLLLAGYGVSRRIQLLDPTIRLLGFWVGGIGAFLLVYVPALFQPRYLYTTVPFFVVLLAWGLWASLRAATGPGPRVRRSAAGLGFAALGTLAVSLVATSPLVRRDGMDKWHLSAQIAHDTLGRVDELVAGLAPGSRLFLVNFPFRFGGPYLPWPVMLLEHSVQGWLDLRFPDKRFDVVGLSYFDWDPSSRDLAVDIEMNPDRLLQVRLLGDGEATGFPWSTQYSKGYEGTLYRFDGPRRGDQLSIRLLSGVGEAEPLFLVWRFDGVELKRGWNWRIASRVPGTRFSLSAGRGPSEGAGTAKQTVALAPRHPLRAAVPAAAAAVRHVPAGP